MQRFKLSACLVCRKSKIKCDWSPDEAKCKRCIQLSCECIRPNFQPGRQKGIKNKRKGLDKALFQIEQAVKRAKSGKQTTEDTKALSELDHLLSGASSIPPASSSQFQHSEPSETHPGPQSPSSSSSEDEIEGTLFHQNDAKPFSAGNLIVDDAENPLELLARASNLQLSPAPGHPSPRQSIQPGPKDRRDQTQDAAIQSFFTSVRVSLDVGDDIDPISLGFVTETEAVRLFRYFHENLAHTRWGLDSELYTVEFTRSRSAFLFTSILAASALFRPRDGALSRRLSTHCKNLAHRVISQRHRSVEIVLAFMVNVPWIFPGKHSTDDDTCWYVTMAMTIAIDLQVHRLLVPMDRLGSVAAVSRGDCVDPQTAMAIDGFSHIDPASVVGRRLLRQRERCWLSLFVLERGTCLARGRSFVVPLTLSLKRCDNWHRSDIADPMDAHLISIAILRRDLDGLFATVRAMCDGSQKDSSDGSLIAQSIQGTIERFFDQWYTDWGISIGRGPDRKLPPYVDILVTHTRLSIYSGVINHHTAPIEVRQFFRTAGMSSALTVMRVAIQGESLLQSMPNNTAIMITFAACFALNLSAYASGSSNLTPSVRALIEETADVLERVGNKTDHRNGLSALYGRYLRYIVKKAATTTDNNPPPIANFPPAPADPSSSGQQFSFAPSIPTTRPDFSTVTQSGSEVQYIEPQLWPGALQFSSMSDEQIAEFLKQPDNIFDPEVPMVPLEDMDNFEGLSWSNLPGFNFGY